MYDSMQNIIPGVKTVGLMGGKRLRHDFWGDTVKKTVFETNSHIRNNCETAYKNNNLKNIIA